MMIFILYQVKMNRTTRTKTGTIKMTKKKKLHLSKYPIICILEENKICDNCCDCFVCDLDPNKVCDSCAKCLDTSDYNAIIIDDILTLEESVDKRNEKSSDRKSFKNNKD